MRFLVEDIEAAVTELRDCGVVFEEYDLPGLMDYVYTHAAELGAMRL